jgi:hypothetical protein
LDEQMALLLKGKRGQRLYRVPRLGSRSQPPPINIKSSMGFNQVSLRAFRAHNQMEVTMCDYSLEAYRSRPARLGERYNTHLFESHSIGFVAPGDASTAVCMECDMKLRLEGIPERVQRAKRVSANEDATFTRIEKGFHHDGVRFANGAEVTLQELGPGVKGFLYDALSSAIWMPDTERRSTLKRASETY